MVTDFTNFTVLRQIHIHTAKIDFEVLNKKIMEERDI